MALISPARFVPTRCHKNTVQRTLKSRTRAQQYCLRLLSALDFASDLTFCVYCEFSRAGVYTCKTCMSQMLLFF